MPLDQAKLHICQLKGLIEHSVGHADLSHIMQHRHIINILDLLIGPAQTLRQKLCIRCHPHGVSFCIVILRIHCIGNRHNRLDRDAFHLLCLFIQPALQIFPITVQFNGASDPAEHDIRFKGFGNVITCPHTETLNLRLCAAVSRQKDHRNLTPAGILLQCRHHLKTTDLRHIDVQKNQIRHVTLQILKCLFSRIYGNCLVLSFKEFLRRRQRQSVIIDNQDYFFHLSPILTM